MNIVIDIEKKVNSEVMEGHLDETLLNNNLLSACNSDSYKIHVTDNIKEALYLCDNGYVVVPVMTDDNKNEDFSSFKYIITNPEEIDETYYYKIWQRFYSLPWHILDTDRCVICEMTKEDVAPLYDLYEDPEITLYTEPLFPNYEDELEYTHNYIHNVYEYFGFGTWIVKLKKDGKIIGRAGFNYRPGYDEPEIGYMIGKKYQNQGFGYEVCNAIIKYIHDEFDFDKIIAFSSPLNIPSLKLLKHLGFVEDKTILPPPKTEELPCDLISFKYINL